MELVDNEDDEARSPSSFSSWVVHIVKSEIVKDISSATPNKVSTMTSTYSSRISELCVISGKISSLLDQLRAFDYYNK